MAAPPKWNEAQVAKAVAALQKFIGARETNDLLSDDDELLYLVRFCRAYGNLAVLRHAEEPTAACMHAFARTPAATAASVTSLPPPLHRCWLQVIALKKIPQKPRNDKPIRIPIPHPIYTTENVEVCLFVKDHKGELCGLC